MDIKKNTSKFSKNNTLTISYYKFLMYKNSFNENCNTRQQVFQVRILFGL